MWRYCKIMYFCFLWKNLKILIIVLDNRSLYLKTVLIKVLFLIDLDHLIRVFKEILECCLFFCRNLLRFYFIFVYYFFVLKTIGLSFFSFAAVNWEVWIGIGGNWFGFGLWCSCFDLKFGNCCLNFAFCGWSICYFLGYF